MQPIALANLPLRFLLELASLAAFGYFGGTIVARPWMRTLAAVALPALVALFWGIFVSPKARIPTGHVGRALLGLVVFLAAAATLHARGAPRLAMGFALVALVSSLVSLAIRLPNAPPST